MPEVWTLERINQLISDQQPETLHLEYKAAAALDFKIDPKKGPEKRTQVSKDISSFANSDGGTILYGISETAGADKNIRIPDKVDPVHSSIISKESLEQFIHSNISPKITGLIITPVIVSGGIIFVIDVPKGITAYQASDFIYYKRHNFMSTPMDDYEVKDVINRLTTPHLTIEFLLLPYRSPTKDYFELHVLVNNVGSIVANHINCKLEIQSRSLEGYENYRADMLHPFFLYNYWKINPSPIVNGRPLLPGMAMYLKRSPATDICFQKFCLDPENLMQFTLSADNMAPIRETVKVSTFRYVTSSELPTIE